MQRRELFKGALALLATAVVAPKELFAHGGIVPPGPPYIVGLQPCEFKLTKEQIAELEADVAPPFHPNCRCVMQPYPVIAVHQSKDIRFVAGCVEFYTTNPAFATLQQDDIIELDGLSLARVESVKRRFSTHIKALLLPNLTQGAGPMLRTSVNASAGQFNE